MLFGDEGEIAYYWLGSYFVLTDSDSASFGVYVVADGYVVDYGLTNSSGNRVGYLSRCSSPSFSSF